jgi:hypothetical protein
MILKGEKEKKGREFLYKNKIENSIGILKI